MSGDFDEDTLAQIATGQLQPRNFVQVAFDEGTRGFWDDIDDIVIDGVPYLGTGKISAISDIPGTIDLSADSVTATLSGLDPDVIGEFLSLSWHLRPVAVFCLLFDNGLRNTFASSLFDYSGIIDKATKSGGGGQSGNLVISIADALSRGAINSLGIRSNGDQRRRASNDGLFSRASFVGRQEVYWGVRQKKFKSPGSNNVSMILHKRGG